MDYFVSQEDANLIMVMVDESTGEKYARAVGHKGLELIKDMSNELKMWVLPSGTAGNIILKSDGEPAIFAVRDALAKYHESQSYKKGQLSVNANRMDVSRRR